MRQNIFIRIVWTLIFLLCHHLYLAAQCPADVTLTAKVTKSVGPSDGSFTITTAVVGANSSSVTYSFEAIPLTPGASHPAPTSTFVINNLAPGTYDLVMKATCVHDNDIVITKTLKNLVVQGDYVLPTISESKLKQGSFDNCPMGILAVNVQNGGSTFTCTIKSAPAGVALGEVAYSVLPGANKSYEYILNGTYPAGTYTIDVSDQYGKGREINITLEQLTVADLPTIALPATWVHESFLPGPDCNHIYFRHIGQYNYQLTKEDFKKYYDKGEFEMAIAPTGKTPVHWAPITIPSIFHPEQLFDISPYTISDLHTHGISVFVRLKNCPTISNERQLKLSKPSFQHVGSQAQCEKYGWRIYEPNFRFQGLWCYPVTLTLHENSKTGPVVGTYTINSINDAVTMPVDYNKTWYVEASDGTNTWEAITFPERFVDYVKLQRQTFCNGWRKFYNLNTFAACVPLVIKIERESDGYAQSVQLIKNRTDFNYFGPSDTRGFDKVSDILEYGVDYRIKVYKPTAQPSYGLHRPPFAKTHEPMPSNSVVGTPVPAANTPVAYSSVLETMDKNLRSEMLTESWRCRIAFSTQMGKKYQDTTAPSNPTLARISTPRQTPCLPVSIPSKKPISLSPRATLVAYANSPRHGEECLT